MAPFVALAGFMGSGKSSVGRRLAGLLGTRFVDLDEVFVEAENVSIPEFFATRGEAAFRGKECDLLQKLVTGPEVAGGLVLALGGGTLESPSARHVLAGHGGTVYLEIEPARAWARVNGSGRPLAVDRDQFEALLERRRPVYEYAADWVLPVQDRSEDELAAEIAEAVRAAGEVWPRLWGRRLRATQRRSFLTGGVGSLGTVGFRAAQVHARGGRAFVITDQNVMSLWGDRVVSLLGDLTEDRVLVVEAGEASKSVATLARCWDWLAEQGARRDDVVVALGGGVVGDLAGLAAATYQRGVSLWQVPTTLLAQVDSSVGGKTAIDLGAGKNLVGAFYQPDLVFADPETLATLRPADYVGGLAEVTKHCLLMPAGALERLEDAAAKIMARDPATLSWVVKESVWFKASVVQEDERESGRRAILNLGHTIGHALEVTEGFGCLSHGEAVSLGLLVALAVSEKLCGLDRSIRGRTAGLLSYFGLPTSAKLPPTEILLEATKHDKKARAGTTGFVALKALGEPAWGLDVSRELLTETLEVIRA